MMRCLRALWCTCVLLSAAAIEGYRDPNCPNSGPSSDKVLAFSRPPSSKFIVCDSHTVELYCCVDGYSYMYWMYYYKPTQVWKHVYLTNRFYLDAKDKNQTLRLEDVNIYVDNTTYRCIAEDDEGNSLQYDVMLLIKDCSTYDGDPIIMLPESETAYRLPGQDIERECKVFFGPSFAEKTPSASIMWRWTDGANNSLEWTDPDQGGPASDRITVSWIYDEWSISAILYVQNISQEDYGNYTCVGSTVTWREERRIHLLYGDASGCTSPPCSPALDERARVAVYSLSAIILVMLTSAVIYRHYRLEVNLYIKDAYKKPPPTSRDKFYDAFLVHNPDDAGDRNLCIKTLLPTLGDQHDYRIAVMERDSIPGKSHLENYDSLVSSSQCLVFIVSRGLIQCEYCEYVFAQVIEQDYKNMIFIYREEVEDSEFGEHKAPMLAAIKVAKYVLHWPDTEETTTTVTTSKHIQRKKKFWKQLRYALPPRLNKLPNALPCPRYGHCVPDRRPLLAGSQQQLEEGHLLATITPPSSYVLE